MRRRVEEERKSPSGGENGGWRGEESTVRKGINLGNGWRDRNGYLAKHRGG